MSSLGDLLLAHLKPNSSEKVGDQDAPNEAVEQTGDSSPSVESATHKVFPDRIEKNTVEETQSNASSTDDYVRELLDPDDRPRNVWHVVEGPKVQPDEVDDAVTTPEVPDTPGAPRTPDIPPAPNTPGDRDDCYSEQTPKKDDQSVSRDVEPSVRPEEYYGAQPMDAEPSDEVEAVPRDDKVKNDYRARDDEEKLVKSGERHRDKGHKLSSSSRHRHRDHDRDREREREKGRDRERDRERSRSRDNGRNRDRERDRDRYHGRDRSKDKDRERNRERDRHRSSKKYDHSDDDDNYDRRRSKDCRRSGSRSKSSRRRDRSRSDSQSPITKRNSRTILIMQLNPRVNSRDLDDFFSEIGPVREVRLIMDSKTRRHKGIAYIEFEDASSASKAFSLNGREFFGAAVVIQSAQVDKNRPLSDWQSSTSHTVNHATSHSSSRSQLPPNSYRVYVGGLHVNLTEEMIRSVFEPFGPIIRIELMKDRVTNVSRGYAFITYADIEDGQNACQSLDGFELAGKALRVSKSTDKSERHTNADHGNMSSGRSGGGSGSGYHHHDNNPDDRSGRAKDVTASLYELAGQY